MKIHTMPRVCALIPLFLAAMLAAEQRGIVKFNGQPVPGASVTVLLDGRSATVATGADGTYELTNLAERLEVLTEE